MSSSARDLCHCGLDSSLNGYKSEAHASYSPHLMLGFQVLEEIRLGLELNDYGMQQRRLAHMRFLGELYNYEHVDSSVIFETLYLILVFGHGTAEVLIFFA